MRPCPLPHASAEKNFVHQDEIRRDAIKREEYAARDFPDTWGFLCGPKLEAETHGFARTIAKYHGGVGSWTLVHKRIVDDSALGLKAREIDNALKPKIGKLTLEATHRSNVKPGLVDKYGRTLIKTDLGYDCIPTRSAALALRSHHESTVGDSVRIRGFDPKEKYKYPLTASQELGWRPRPLEIFGVAEFGLKKGIAAEYGYK